MRLDHVSYAAEHDGVRATAERLGAALGIRPINGGVHPTFGTRNVILPLAGCRYVEVVEVLDHPVCDKAPFGQAVRARSGQGGGWMGWVVRVDDLAPYEARLGRTSVDGHRVFPDGRTLNWRQLGVKGLMSDPQLPFFVQYANIELHPSRAAEVEPQGALSAMCVAGDPDRVREWLGVALDYKAPDITFDFIAPHGQAGLLSVTFQTTNGPVTL